MSVARNNLVRQVQPASLFESAKPVLSTNSLCTWNQGDLIAFDSNRGFLRPVTGSGDAGIIVGVALQTIVNGVKPSPYQGTAVDASEAIDDVGGPMFGSVFQMVLQAGGTFTPGAYVYPTTDPQTVSPTGSWPCGIYQGLQVTQGSTAYGDCLIGSTYLASSGSVRFF